jgi:methanogenic corrinoid protein MtbC1
LNTSAPDVNAFHLQVGEALHAERAALVAQMVEREFVRHPELEQRYGQAVRARMIEDTGYHLAYLAQAVSVNRAELFVEYIGWAKVMLASRGVPAPYLATLLESMKESVRAQLPAELCDLPCEHLDYALRQLPTLPDEVPSFIAEKNPFAPLATAYLEALLRGERDVASQLILDAAGRGTAVRDLYLHVFQPAQYELGRLWQLNQINVAQEHYCSAATQLIMSQLYPRIFGAKKTRGTLVAACVAGDLHEIGARMVSDLFEMDGWHTHYLGASVPTPSIIQTVVRLKATVLALSATITYHVRAVAELIAAVRRTSECAGLIILVGGFPFNVAPGLWREVGADGSAQDAPDALTLANRLSTEALAA